MINNSNNGLRIAQGLTAGTGTLLTTGAVVTAAVPAIYTITAYLLPLILGSGAIAAWVALTAETIAGCAIKPKPALLPPSSPPLSEKEDTEEKVSSSPSPPDSPIPVKKEKSPVHSPSPSPSLSETEESDSVPRTSSPSPSAAQKEAVEMCRAMVESCLSAAKENHDKVVVGQIEGRLQLTLLSIENLIASEVDDNLSIITKQLEDEINDINTILESVKECDDEQAYQDYPVISEILELLAANRQEWDSDKAKQLPLLLDKLHNINRPIPSSGGSLFIHVAIQGKDLEAIDYLSECWADFNAHETMFGNTALLWALANAHNSMAMKIIEAGKKRISLPPNWDEKDNEGKTALILAVAKGYREKSSNRKTLAFSNYQIALALLEAGANVNAASHKGITALHLAVLRRDVETVKLLLKYKPDPAAKYQLEGSSYHPVALLALSYEKAKNITTNIAQVCSFPSQTEFDAATADIQKLLS